MTKFIMQKFKCYLSEYYCDHYFQENKLINIFILSKIRLSNYIVIMNYWYI